ncbi:hypothetical protein F2Q68_00036329 [Brassica cretica]|uniref:F-box domain-containing protein n=1 Tax=Brassica cretica TaxID=69181 RepID=A0A8S9H734_BRACR|nr:hypothetical protein F2Q68_00036329 [Brassica cretica]
MDLKRRSCLRNRDRISELPDALLLQILSFVPTKDAVATSVLSKRWRYLCKMMPRLRFWYERTDDLERFSDNVCRFLLSHQAPVLQSLHLEVNFERGSTMDIGVLLGVAFGLHVRELELQVYSWEPYRFPTSLYKCRTLETLKLGSRVLLDVSFPVCLKALRTLSLFDVSYKDDGSVVNLLSGCSVLENLEVMMFSHPHLGTFTIHVPSLQNLTLISDSEDFTVFVINAPHLKYLNLKGLIDEDSCLIENTPEKNSASVSAFETLMSAELFSSYSATKRCHTLSNGDRISELPDALLLQILSLIPTKDAVATSVLSKRWRFLCKMTPNLRFCYHGTKGLVRFSDNVCRCLLSHQAPVLQSLHLKMILKNDSTIDVGVLLGIAFGRHVRELELEVYSSDEPYSFPTSLYNCGTGTLETLKLGHNVLVDVPFPVCLKALRTLRLNAVSYNDAGSVVNLLSGCSSLENLEVMMYLHPDVENFTIDVPSLQCLTLIAADEEYAYFSSYVINAPSLKYLNLKGLIDEESSLLIENMPELVEAHITDVCDVIYANIHGSLTSVKRLSLDILSPLDLTKFPTDIIFKQLVYLELHIYAPERWNLLILMLHSSPNLQVLKLIGEWFRKRDHPHKRWSQPKYVPECLVNRIETLVWNHYNGEVEDERKVAQYILRNASRLETATFSRLDIHLEKRLERLKELESVVWASNSCQLVFK